MSYQYYTESNEDDKRKYKTKLDIAGLKRCPYRASFRKWSDDFDFERWPADVFFIDIHEYLTSTPGIFTKETMKYYKSPDAYKKFTSGCVQDLKFQKPDNYVFTAKVMDSDDESDKQMQPWVALARDFSVICSHCNCPAGEFGEDLFSHWCYTIQNRENGYEQPSPPCDISSDYDDNDGYKDDEVKNKSIQAARICDIKFYDFEEDHEVTEHDMKFNNNVKTENSEPPKHASFNNLTAEQKKFLDNLSTLDPKPVVLSLFKEYAHHFQQQ